MTGLRRRLAELDDRVLGPRRRQPLWTTVVQSAGTFGMVYGGSRAASLGFGDPAAFVPLGVGLGLYAVVLRWWFQDRRRSRAG